MVDELELGQATIVYDHPEDGVVEETVDNEAVVYARDHWMIRTGTDDQDNDRMKQIPRDRVHRVDRTVERFEEETRTVRRRVESLASGLRRKLPVDIGDGQDGRERRRKRREHPEPTGESIPVEDGDSR
mgnify:CR=1 FL=1